MHAISKAVPSKVREQLADNFDTSSLSHPSDLLHRNFSEIELEQKDDSSIGRSMTMHFRGRTPDKPSRPASR